MRLVTGRDAALTSTVAPMVALPAAEPVDSGARRQRGLCARLFACGTGLRGTPLPRRIKATDVLSVRIEEILQPLYSEDDSASLTEASRDSEPVNIEVLVM